MTILFWDIDGTLLTTGRAGISAWEGAVEALTGARPSLESFRTAGLTDVEIARLLLREREHDESLVMPLLREYESRLPSALPKREGRVLPQVREILSALKDRNGVRMILLTGNSRRGAAAKLTHYRLVGFFEHGAYADDASDRPGVARAALAVARSVVGTVDLERTFVIGDTPADIACGSAIGARTIAVATGPYSLEALGRSGPSLLFSELPEPKRFAEAIGVAG